eukprot:scaffold24246_cov106-Isochrysis_galbana.AAC.1
MRVCACAVRGRAGALHTLGRRVGVRAREWVRGCRAARHGVVAACPCSWSLVLGALPCGPRKKTPRARGGVTMAPRQLRLEPTEVNSTADKGAKRVRVDSNDEKKKIKY